MRRGLLNFWRDSNQQLHGDWYSVPQSRLEFPSAERNAGRFVHLACSSPIYLEVCDSSVRLKDTLKHDHLAQLVMRNGQSAKIEFGFWLRGHNSSSPMDNNGV